MADWYEALFTVAGAHTHEQPELCPTTILTTRIANEAHTVGC
jgi:hypothetical protein